MSAGLSDDIGSWKIIAILLPRIARMPASSSLSRSRPSKITSPLSMRPGGFGIRRRIDSAVTLLPDPLSPTIATVSPAATSNESASTAVHRAALGAKPGGEVADLQQGRGHAVHSVLPGRGLKAREPGIPIARLRSIGFRTRRFAAIRYDAKGQYPIFFFSSWSTQMRA